ncbi:MAG TPA: AraC family transcriptional regulator [Gemmataceae bacterium]|nr:AraC family transcriptional regulator [Gemmataceae bacterium]
MNELARLAAAVERLTGADGAYPTPVPGLTLHRASRPTGPQAVVYEPVLAIVAQGGKEVVLAGKKYRYDAAHSLLVSVDVPVTARVAEASPDRPCLVIRLAINPAVVGELLADGAPAGLSGPPDLALGVCPVEPPLLDAVTRLVSLIDCPRDVPILSQLALREITYRVLTGPQGPRLRQIAAAGAPAHRIAAAVRWLRDHLADPLRVEALARKVGMSVSAFHLHFKHVTTLSPLQYLKRLRLQEARKLMVAEGLDAAEAGFRVGYESPSQFGREYRRMFGQSPYRDVAAVRVESLPAGHVGV